MLSAAGVGWLLAEELKSPGSTSRYPKTVHISPILFDAFLFYFVMHLGYYICGALAAGLLFVSVYCHTSTRCSYQIAACRYWYSPLSNHQWIRG